MLGIYEASGRELMKGPIEIEQFFKPYKHTINSK